MPTADQWIAIAAIGGTIVAATIGGWFTLRRRAEARHSNVAHQRGQGHTSIQTGDLHFSIHAPPLPSSPARLPKRRADASVRQSVPQPRAPTQEMKRDPPRPACDEGPFDAGPGGHTKIFLDVNPGDRVRGHLEADGDFEFDIVNSANYARLARGERFSAAKNGEGEAAYYIDWKVRGRGPWYLVLEAYGKKYDREVHIQLTAAPK